jgi:protein-tyrosine phosphatase
MPGDSGSFVDIHCHLLPGIDDGAASWDETLAMARLAVAEGIETIVCTPHQLGSFGQNRGDDVRALTQRTREFLAGRGVPLNVLPGADVRIEDGMLDGLAKGDVLTLGDHRRHVLLELPHELYFPLERLLEQLASRQMVGILSHPERNQGLQRQPGLIGPLVEAGCLMQLTAGSLIGGFGPDIQRFSEWLLGEGLVHFVSTDAHSSKSRRPRMRKAFDRIVELTDRETAVDLCGRHPAAVAAGGDVPGGRRIVARPGLASRWRSGLASVFSGLSRRAG